MRSFAWAVTPPRSYSSTTKASTRLTSSSMFDTFNSCWRRKRFTGVLKNVSNGVIEVEVDNEIYDLPFAEMASARLVPEF